LRTQTILQLSHAAVLFLDALRQQEQAFAAVAPVEIQDITP